jgi:hypothetical protein
VPQLLLKRTTTQNAPTGLSAGEAAWSENGFLYIGRADGSVVPIAQVQGLFRVASEALFAGAIVNLWKNGTLESARLANAAAGYPAHGYVTQVVTSGSVACVITTLGGINKSAQVVTGSTLATGSYVLSSEAGKIAPLASAPAAPAIYQLVGNVSGSDLIFYPDMVVSR